MRTIQTKLTMDLEGLLDIRFFNKTPKVSEQAPKGETFICQMACHDTMMVENYFSILCQCQVMGLSRKHNISPQNKVP
jgi:hypothetical protein